MEKAQKIDPNLAISSQNWLQHTIEIFNLGNQKLKFMNLAVSMAVPLSLDMKTSRTEPFSDKDDQKST